MNECIYVCTESSSLAGPVVGTLFATAIVTAVVSVLVTVLVMIFFCKTQGKEKHEKSYQYSSNSAYATEAKSVDPPSKPPPVHKPSQPKPAQRPPPPRPAPRHVWKTYIWLLGVLYIKSIECLCHSFFILCNILLNINSMPWCLSFSVISW